MILAVDVLWEGAPGLTTSDSPVFDPRRVWPRLISAALQGEVVADDYNHALSYDLLVRVHSHCLPHMRAPPGRAPTPCFVHVKRAVCQHLQPDLRRACAASDPRRASCAWPDI